MLEAQGYPATKGALTAVANHLGVHARTLSRWFNKEQNPPPDQLVSEKRGDFVEQCNGIIDLLFTEIKTAIPDAPLNQLAMTFGIVTDKRNHTTESGSAVSDQKSTLTISADLLASSFVDVYRDIRSHKYTEYLFYGGRGSTKSSFISLALICELVNHPGVHALVTRQVGNTLRDSVYSQLQWAIGELGVYHPGLADQFKSTTSPMEITYLPTGQKIYFRGLDNPAKIKSITPVSGHIGIFWIEEADQAKSAEHVRKVEQSIRGGEFMMIFKSWNPPRSAQNWINKYTLIPKSSQRKHTSDYRLVPRDWLGEAWLAEAEHLKSVNPRAYDNEYLGEITGTGGMVFENVTLRKITDAEIKEFDHIYFGLDFGYAIDPLHWVKLHYDAKKGIIFIFDEFRAHKMGNRELYEILTAQKGMTRDDLLICDSAEPKSISDLRSYGLNVRGSEKGHDSVRYSLRWLENRAEIVVDPERCPYVAEELISYEYEQTRDGEFTSQYPDRNNHGIDGLRYSLNTWWRRSGT
jgi:PBSX family phage terminase large subunit